MGLANLSGLANLFLNKINNADDLFLSYIEEISGFKPKTQCIHCLLGFVVLMFDKLVIISLYYFMKYNLKIPGSFGPEHFHLIIDSWL